MSSPQDPYNSPALRPLPTPESNNDGGNATPKGRFSLFPDCSSTPYQRFCNGMTKPSISTNTKHDNIGSEGDDVFPKTTTHPAVSSSETEANTPSVADDCSISTSPMSLPPQPLAETSIRVHPEEQNSQHEDYAFEAPYETRISWLHYGPYYPGAPCMPPESIFKKSGDTGTYSSQPTIRVEVPEDSKEDQSVNEGVTCYGSECTYDQESSSFLENSSCCLSNHQNRDSCEISEDLQLDFDDGGNFDRSEFQPIDLSTLEGGSIELRSVSAESGLSCAQTMFDPTENYEKNKTDYHSANCQPSIGKGSQPKKGSCVASWEGPAVSVPSTSGRRGRKVRSKSIRKMGQNLAEQNQAIVAISDGKPTIDLSSLGIAKHDSLSDPKTSNEPLNPDNHRQSYFYPADPEQPDWKPFTMRTFFMIPLIVLACGIAALQEYLCQISAKLEKQSDGILKFDDVSDVSLSAFFCWKYLPTIVFVAYGVLWQMTDYDTKRLEPYYQLSQPTGSVASTSLNLDYFSISMFLVPVKAFRCRHWAVFCASIGSLFATTVAPSLQNPSVVFDDNPLCNDSCPDGQSKYFVRIQPIWSRLLTASLLIVSLSGIFLFIQLRRKSGLLSDPKGIAGVASMATRSHILNDFQGMDETRHDKIHKMLKHHRYILYKSTIWHGEFIEHEEQSDPDEKPKLENPHPFILTLKSGIPLLVSFFICLVLVPIINFTPANKVSIKLPWLPVLIATLIKQVWTTLEFAVRAIEPFYVLSKGNARPQATLTLDYRGTPYGILPFLALRNKHFIVALVGFGSVLGDILTVTVSSFSINGNELTNPNSYLKDNKKTRFSEISVEDQTFVSFWTSIALSIAILLFLIISASLIYARRRHAFLPRQPPTIASVLAFIHQSNMLDDFVDTERLNNREMEKRLAAKGKRYGLGWFRGRDGKPHCAVDQEPMLSKYAHGMSYIRATAPWEDI